jgi:hypothetical protein
MRAVDRRQAHAEFTGRVAVTKPNQHHCWPPIHLIVTSGLLHITEDHLPPRGRLICRPYQSARLSLFFWNYSPRRRQGKPELVSFRHAWFLSVAYPTDRTSYV